MLGLLPPGTYTLAVYAHGTVSRALGDAEDGDRNR